VAEISYANYNNSQPLPVSNRQEAYTSASVCLVVGLSVSKKLFMNFKKKFLEGPAL